MRCYSTKPANAVRSGLQKANMSSSLPANGSQPGIPATVFRTALRSLERIHEGKVRDIYAIDPQLMLIVTTDRLSAFDVVMPEPIPEKGRVLNKISNFWFERTRHLVPNHLTDIAVDSIVQDSDERALLSGRTVIVRRLKALPIEAVVRGYLIGSGWKDYQKTGGICGITLPPGLKQAERLPEPLFTPASKAAPGEHDENISFSQVAGLVGAGIASQVRDTALALYAFAAEHARSRGIIIADTKFEFGLDPAGKLTLIDEVLTPDSSRFWPADTYRTGTSPPSFDKQIVRDYLETLDWNKKAPGPSLPPQVIKHTSEKYQEALARLMGPTTV
jgi:phosphoribosylaminoimidazole-succinocarboxamide synthase